MNKSLLLAAASVIALSAGCAQAAGQPVPSFAGKSNLFQILKGGKYLYNQNSHDNGVAVNSQNFTGGSSSSYNDQGADDFVVPSGKVWTVTEVDVTGQYYNGSGPSTSESVIFYKDKKGMPGRPVRKGTFENLDGGSGPDFALKLPGKGAQLKAGTYWVSVISNMGFYPSGLWGWEMNDKQHGNEAMWRNPPGGYGVCPNWGTLGDCIGYAGDLMFALRGTSADK